MLACEEEEEKQPPQVIQFTSDQIFLTEGASTTIFMPFRSPVPNAGTVVIHLSNNAVYGQDYTTVPAAVGNSLTLTIASGQRSVQFQIVVADDNVVNQSRTAEFNLQSTSAGFMLGSRSKLTLTINDNEGFVPEPPVGEEIFASLELQNLRVAESKSSGIAVSVRLFKNVLDDWGYGSVTVPATGTGSVIVKFASGHAAYGNEFNTVPAAAGDSLVINFTGTQTDTTFTVIPIDNGTFGGSRFISMRVARATSDFHAVGTVYWLEIEDDETGPNQITWTKLQNTSLPGASSAKFYDENNGYIWGQNKLYKTTDGGLNWDELVTDPAKAYSQIIPFFINDQIGFVSALEYDCGYYDYDCYSKTTIFKTINGGGKWTAVKELEFNVWVSSLYFLSESTGFIGTANGEILKTVDGGINWELVDGPVYGYPLSDFVFLDNGTGYVRSYNSILKTVDSGDSWTASFSAGGESSGITSLARSSGNSLYALWRDCEDLPMPFRTIYKSDDGTNWVPASECILAERLSLSSSGNLGVSLGNLLHDKWQSDVHLTLNNGSSWSLQSMPVEPGPLWFVAIASDQVVYLLGDDGLLLKGEIE